MYLRFRYRLGFEALCVEVADSLAWRRFCRVPLGERVPHPSRVRAPTRSPCQYSEVPARPMRLTVSPASVSPALAARPGQAPDRASTGLDVQDPERILVTGRLVVHLEHQLTDATGEARRQAGSTARSGCTFAC